MKKSVFLSIFTFFLFFFAGTMSSKNLGAVFADSDKVNICHKDGRSGNYSALSVDDDGDWNGHEDHTGDYLYTGPVKDDGKPDNKDKKADNWCEDNAPVTPVDCVGNWNTTDICSVDCGGGNFKRTYSITTPKVGTGESCSNENGDFDWNGARCNTQSCYTPICGNERLDTGEQCDDANTKNNDGCSSICQNETPVCNDEIANNYQSVGKGEYANNEECTYSTHRWCVLQEDESYVARAIPNNQENPTGKPWETGMDKNCEFKKDEPTPSPTPEPEPVCVGDQHLDAARKNCVSFSGSGVQEPTGPAIGGAQVLGASTINSGGQVLGASTMAKTGAVEDALFNSIFTLGSLLTSFGIMKNGKKKA